MGTWRPIGVYEKEMSPLAPGLPKYWRIESTEIDVSYDTHETKAAKHTWKRDIDFTLESRLLSDFSEKV